jgi:hypothetical protein
MTVKFGPRKVGLAKFKLAQVQEKQTSKFGPRKFGARKAAVRADELAAAKQAVAAERAATQAAKAPPVADPVAPAPEQSTGSLSINQIGEHLEENPALYEEFYLAELGRAEQPRKGALRIFLALEQGKDEPNPKRIAEIERFLA